MSDICPCCGQLIKGADLKVSMEFNTVICGDRALKLTPKQCEIVYVLQRAWPHTLPTSRLISQVWGHAEVDDPTVRNTIYTARKRLKTIDYTIRATHSRGYRIERLRMMSR